MKLQNLEKPSAAVSDTVDVIADSNYSNVSEAYNHAFRAWRNKEDNPYAFRCKKQKKKRFTSREKGFMNQTRLRKNGGRSYRSPW